MAPRISPPTFQPLNTSQPSQPPQRTQMLQGVANTPTSLSPPQQEGLCAKLRKIIESIKQCLSRLFPINPKEAKSSSQSNQAPIPPSISTPSPSLQQHVIKSQSPTTSEKPNSPHINPPLITAPPVQPLPQNQRQVAPANPPVQPPPQEPTASDLAVVRPPLNLLDAAGQTPLENACRGGDIEGARALIQAGALNTEPADNLRNTLFYLCESQQVELLRIYTDARVNLDQRDPENNSLIHVAVVAQNPQILQLLIDGGAPIDQQNNAGDTPLLMASDRANPDVVRILIQSGANINAAGVENRRPIHRASIAGHHQIIRELIAGGSPLNETEQNNRRPIDLACINSRREAVEALIQGGVELSINPILENNPLHIACWLGSVEIAEQLLIAGIPINTPNLHIQYTPIHIACSINNQNLVELLLRYHPDLRARSREPFPDDEQIIEERIPIEIACANNNAEIVRLLIQADAMNDLPDENHPILRCLTTASENNNLPMIRALTSAQDPIPARVLQHLTNLGLEALIPAIVNPRIDINAPGGDNGNTLLHIASNQGRGEDVAILLRFGATPNLVDNEGNTPLHLAAEMCHLNSMMTLMNASPASVNQPNHRQETPLHYASRARANREANSLRAIELLLNNGANPNAKIGGEITLLHIALINADGDLFQLLCRNPNIDLNVPALIGNTPLHSAAQVGSFQNMIDLIERRARMDAIDGDGANILHYAAKSRNDPVRKIQMLLSNEFNINAQDRKRMTPLHYAYRFRNQPAIEELIRLGADQNIQDENGRTPAQVEAIDSRR